jgi:shikimate dehydrogenase
VRAEELAEAVAGARAMKFRGITCTIPHKTGILACLDAVDEVAARIGAVNTVVCEEGRLIGYNTDWIGIVEPLKQRRSLVGARVAVIGAGGTARAAGFGLQQEGAQVVFLNRTLERARLLADALGGEAYTLEETAVIASCDIVINTTSVGMFPDVERSPLPAAVFQPTQIVMDAIYTPRYTRYLRDAQEKGAVVIAGAEMFLQQGVAQFALYTGISAPVEVMRSVIDEALGR